MTSGVVFLPISGAVDHGGWDHRDRGALLGLRECDAQSRCCCFVADVQTSVNTLVLRVLFDSPYTYNTFEYASTFTVRSL